MGRFCSLLLVDEDLLKIMYLLTEHINVNLVAKQIKIRLNEDAAIYSRKTCADQNWALIH